MGFGAVVWMTLQASCARSVSSADDTAEKPLFSPDAGGMTPFNACIPTDCPKPWATCPGTNGLCTTDTGNDVNHCGSCEHKCPAATRASHSTTLCTGGQCAFACNELYADCNHLAKDGCETSTGDDPLNCGFCGNACKTGDLCWRGACGCPNGFTQCGQECVDTTSDRNNCSACNKLCRAPTDDADPAWICGPKVTPANTEWVCGNSACMLSCKAGFGDCNKQFCADGCELDLTSDPKNCGACGHACDAGQTCSQGACLCPAGTTLCGDECVDTNVDTNNCGSCGGRCSGPSARRPGQIVGGGPICKDGKCDYVCSPGFADCDGDIDNGCEVNLTNDTLHCGSCKTPCPLGVNQPCVSGKCLSKECDSGTIL